MFDILTCQKDYVGMNYNLYFNMSKRLCGYELQSFLPFEIFLQGRKILNLRKFQNETNFTGSLLEVNSKLYTFAENWNRQVWTKVSLIINDIRLDFGNRDRNLFSSQISHGHIWEGDQKAFRNVENNILSHIDVLNI